MRASSEEGEGDDYTKEADPVCRNCGAHRGHETAQVREVRGTTATGGGRGLRGGGGKRVDNVSPGRRQSFRHQRRPMEDCSPGRRGMSLRRRKKGQSISWRNGLLQKKQGLDYGMY